MPKQPKGRPPKKQVDKINRMLGKNQKKKPSNKTFKKRKILNA